MTPDEEKLAFDKYIGQAMTCWGNLELGLCTLFSRLLYPIGRNYVETQAAAVFYAIENFRAKVQTVDALASLVLSGQLLSRWQTIEAHLGKRVKKRNRIAHHDVLFEETKDVGKRYGLIPPFLALGMMRDVNSGKVKPMHIHELKEACAEFTSTGQDLHTLAQDLKNHVLSQIG